MLDQDLKTTPLDALHRELGGKMVPFAGYAMPVQYLKGIMAEHLHCRADAGLFDVSHMGQVLLRGAGADKALEALLPGDICGLGVGKLRYSLFTDQNGGILDDLMITRRENDLYLVVNAGVKDQDIAHLRAHLEPQGILVEVLSKRALIALQGPRAVDVLAGLNPAINNLTFMSAGEFELNGVSCWVSRSGYTGEDGFEISVDGDDVLNLVRQLLGNDLVAPIGLGARDSLRLEAGLCLYGHDINQETTPVEASLGFALSRRRREEGGFPGAAKILDQFKNGVSQRRVGLEFKGRQPVREGNEIIDADNHVIGRITSGGFAPSLGAPVAMGYVHADSAEIGTKLGVLVRGKVLEAEVAAMPFVPNRYFRKTGVKV